MSNVISKRSELLFCYDISDANPNGDPLDENKPRIDEETGINFVTDVRLKRTIRDYLAEFRGFNGKNGTDIFVREKELESGGLQDGKTRAKDFSDSKEKVLKECIDVRLFGGVIPLSKDSITLTGPTQFKMGRSLHKVELKHIQGTGAFASKPGAKNKTFREEYVLPYSFIAFHGIINQNAAAHTGMTDDDAKLLLESIWMGTKNLISRSKFGQQPRFLLKVTYKEPNFFIGDLDRMIGMNCENEVKVRGLNDFTLNIDKLLTILDQYSDRIESIHYRVDPELQTGNQIPSHWQPITDF
ncbi:MAG: type I-B CRISPR-associated protein Cas7/Csh2 [Calditrichaceae bacterium]